jgi:tetratricopeptide (TPR) repeat protein
MSMTLNFFDHSFERGRRLQEAGKTKEAARLFDRIGYQADLPREIAVEALTSLGQFQLELGQVETARRTLETACKRDPHSANAHFLNSQACLAGDDADLERAYEALSEAVELEPEEAEYHAELGKVQIALGLEEEGLESIERAVELEPKSPRFLRDLVDALMDLGDEAKAIETARRAIFQNPKIQGFRTLWNDLRFCQTADEFASEMDLTPRATETAKPSILRFAPIETSGAGARARKRIIREDSASKLAAPHTHLPFIKPDRRLA